MTPEPSGRPGGRQIPRPPAAQGTTSLAGLRLLPEVSERVIHPTFRVPTWLHDMVLSGSGDLEIATTLRDRVLTPSTSRVVAPGASPPSACSASPRRAGGDTGRGAVVDNGREIDFMVTGPGVAATFITKRT